jgi:hypothetical protein
LKMSGEVADDMVVFAEVDMETIRREFRMK